MKQRVQARNGFTLVEIMIAMAVMGIFMVSSVSFMRWVIRATDLSGRLTVVNSITQSKLDELVATKATTGGSGSSGGYAWTWTISTTGSVRYLSVTARFTGLDSANHSITLREMYAP